jgi:hypothetical protein
MLEFAKLLHDAFGSSWPKTFVVLSALVGAFIFGGSALLVVMAARKSATRNPSEAGDLFEKKEGKNKTSETDGKSTESLGNSGPRLGIGPEAYKEIADVQVGQWAIEETDKIQEMVNDYLNSVQQNPIRRGHLLRNFTQDFERGL